jgi:ubiquinone/menaquinone biosynthesis C-methylase UbiE
MSFDRLAPHYRKMEAVLAGKILQQSRTAFLSEAAGCRRALLLGEGPGKFLVELLKQNPAIEVHCVEYSAGMIREAQIALRMHNLQNAHVTFEEANALAWKARPNAFDLIVTSFFLDCFTREELQPLIAKIAASATPGARWLVADFRLPERGWTRWRAQALLMLMYGFFRAATNLSASHLTPPEGFLARAGFRCAQRKTWNLGLVESSLWVRAEK